MDALQGVKEGHKQVHQHSQVEGDAAPEWHVPGAPVQDGLSCKTVECSQLAQGMLRNALQQSLIMQHIQNIRSINSLQQDSQAHNDRSVFHTNEFRCYSVILTANKSSLVDDNPSWVIFVFYARGELNHNRAFLPCFPK